jgi:hypothetical protein
MNDTEDDDKIEASLNAVLSESLQAKHADITSRLDGLIATNRTRLTTIIEEHRTAVAAIETECEAFWEEVYAENPLLTALPERLFVAADGKTLKKGFPHSGVPFAIFDKPEEDVVTADEETSAPKDQAPIEDAAATGARIKAFMDNLFTS